MTDQQDPDETISFRSQTKVGLIAIGVVLALACFATWLFMGENARLTWSQQLHLTVVAGLVYLFTCFVVLSLPAVGSFRIDRNGIEQVVFWRGPRHLRWQDVKRVKWEPNLVCFEGNGNKVSIFWGLVHPKDVSQAKPFLKKVLSPYFNLSPRPVPLWPSLVIEGAWLVITLFLPMTLLSLFPLHDPGWLLTVCLLIACFTLLSGRLRIVQQTMERINPTWRLRRKLEGE